MIPRSDLWMLGLRPVRGVGQADPVGGARSCKFVVAPRVGRWRVLRDDREVETFADPDEAIRFACDQARAQARTGVAGIVVVQGDVHEMHCFTPPHAEVAGASIGPSLRVVGARDDDPAAN